MSGRGEASNPRRTMKIKIQMNSRKVTRTMQQGFSQIQCHYEHRTISCSGSSIILACASQRSGSSEPSSLDHVPSVDFNLSSQEHVRQVDLDEQSDDDSKTVIINSEDEESLSQADLIQKELKEENNNTSYNDPNEDGYSDTSTVLGSIHDDVFDEVPDPTPHTEDIPMLEVSSTEGMQSSADYLPLIDDLIAMYLPDTIFNENFGENSDKVITPGKPRIIANEPYPNKISLCLPSAINFCGFKADEQTHAIAEAKKKSENSVRSEVCFGILQGAMKIPGFQNLSQNVEQEPIVYGFRNMSIRDTSIPSRSESPEYSYVRNNLPDQGERNVIETSRLDSHFNKNTKDTEYIALVSVIQRWKITSDEEFRKLQARLKTRRYKILKKGKLNLNLKTKRRTMSKFVPKNSPWMSKSLKILSKFRKRKSKSEKKEEPEVQGKRTKSLSKILNDSLISEETPNTVVPGISQTRSLSKTTNDSLISEKKEEPEDQGKRTRSLLKTPNGSLISEKKEEPEDQGKRKISLSKTSNASLISEKKEEPKIQRKRKISLSKTPNDTLISEKKEPKIQRKRKISLSKALNDTLISEKKEELEVQGKRTRSLTRTLSDSLIPEKKEEPEVQGKRTRSLSRTSNYSLISVKREEREVQGKRTRSLSRTLNDSLIPEKKEETEVQGKRTRSLTRTSNYSLIPVKREEPEVQGKRTRSLSRTSNDSLISEKKGELKVQRKRKISLSKTPDDSLISEETLQTVVPEKLQTKSVSKTLNDSLLSKETPKPVFPRMSHARKLDFHGFLKNEIKDVRIILSSVDISSYLKNLASKRLTRNSHLDSSLIPHTSVNRSCVSNHDNEEYAHIDYLDSNHIFENSETKSPYTDEDEELPKVSANYNRMSGRQRRPSDKSFLNATASSRRSLRLSQLQSKVKKVSKKRVTFSPVDFWYEF